MLDTTSLPITASFLPNQGTVKEGMIQTVYSYLPAPIRSFSTFDLSNLNLKLRRTFSSAVSKEISDTEQAWQDRGASTLHLYAIQLEQLFQLYAFRKPVEVLRFFRNYPNLIPLLIEAYAKMKFYFLDSQIFLQFVADSDNEDAKRDNGDLVISIVTHLTPLEAVEKLEKFYESWWLYTANEIQNNEKICFNLESL